MKPLKIVDEIGLNAIISFVVVIVSDVPTLDEYENKLRIATFLILFSCLVEKLLDLSETIILLRFITEVGMLRYKFMFVVSCSR